MNSSRLLAAPGARAPAAPPAAWLAPGVAAGPVLRATPTARAGGWTRLAIAFTSPPWVAYVDLRVLVFSETGGGAALVDDFALLVADEGALAAAHV
jgi:hypothetical protein